MQLQINTRKNVCFNAEPKGIKTFHPSCDVTFIPRYDGIGKETCYLIYQEQCDVKRM